MSVILKLFLVTIISPSVFGQAQEDCYGAGSVAGAAIGAFIAALLLVAAAYYFRKLYWKSRKGKHLVFATDPESVKDEFAFDNPGFRQEEKWQNEAPTLPLSGKTHALAAEFTKPEKSRDDSYLQRAQVRRVKLWARDFTGLGLTCGGGARDGVRVQSVLRNGPAAAADVQPGDKIKSIKIEFSGTPLEDAVSILSLASPYPVELEVVGGGRVSGEGWGVKHPLMKAGSTGDVSTLEKEGKLLHPPKSPNTSHSNNSTLETKHGKTGIKKIISEKIITTTTLERNKKERKDPPSTLERENEKNLKMMKNRHSDITGITQKPDKKERHSMGSEIQIIQPENGITHIEHTEVQKREYDPKRGMKFGIRVLPPNVPDDGVLKQKVENGNILPEKVSTDEIDKIDKIDKPEPKKAPLPPVAQIQHENEVEQKKPVVAKRREKLAPPIPNARTKTNEAEANISHESSKISESSTMSSFARTDLNSSGIKRDENGIPQELPQHIFDAAKAARSNRKSSTELIQEKIEIKKEEPPKPSKKSKGKAPSPPGELEKNKSDDSIIEQLRNTSDFLSNEKEHSSILHNTSVTTKPAVTSYTSTPKVNKIKPRVEETMNFTQDDIDDIVSKPFKRESDSLNNFFADSKSNLSSNQDVHSVVSLNNSEKSDRSTTIELNNSDITIHSSPLNDTTNSESENTSIVDEHERKATSLGDLSKFEIRKKSSKPSTGTLERAQSLDISADDEIQESTLSPKKRKAMSVVESTFFDSGTEDVLPESIDSEKGVVIKQKEPRLSLNIAKASAMEGLSTFQRNRLKKGSEFGNLEDAIVKGSSSSIESERHGSQEIYKPQTIAHLSENKESQESSDHLARRIMDENLKVHLKLVTEFAKSTSDGSNTSSLETSQDSQSTEVKTSPVKYEEKVSMSYDTNIPDDMKVSRSSYVNSLERPKSEMMKKLLAKNPIFNVHLDQNNQKPEEASKESISGMTDSFKSNRHQPDVVNVDEKSPDISKIIKHKQENITRDYDDFVSNIRVGSANNSMRVEKKIQEAAQSSWPETKEDEEVQSRNIVTISTNEKVSMPEVRQKYTKSIEIGETNLRRVPDLVEGTKIREDKETRTLYMEPANVSLTMKQEPAQKTVTVNVTEDEFGNKVITQNVEKVSTRYITTKTEVPLQIEQMTFGIMRGGEVNEMELEEGNVKDIDSKILEEIKRQNPNMHFTSTEPAFTRTETIILNTSEMNEEQAKALMMKLQNDPSFMAHKSQEELSRMGIRILQDLEDKKTVTDDTVEVTKTKYSINPSLVSESQKYYTVESKEIENENDHITEIQVTTPRSEVKSTESSKDKISSRQRQPPAVKTIEEPILSYELDIEMLNDFITNEKYHSGRQLAEMKKRTKNEPKKRHSDFDLPRNSHIKFRTATYESPKEPIVTSTDLENRRLSQLDQMQLRSAENTPHAKPVILAKPSNIPVKISEKKQQFNFVSSKIPVFGSQKSYSQENLTEKNFSLPRSPPPNLSSSSGNISVTSIKSSSRSPSGGRLS